MVEYSKILVFQYGKVGSTSLRSSQENSEYCPYVLETYDSYIIQTHSHAVTLDILSKYKNVLVINLVRLPISRNISAFFENIQNLVENYDKLSIDEIIQIYDNSIVHNHNVDSLDKWMNNFFEIFNIDVNNLKFNKTDKYNKITFNGNDILLCRFEDLKYLIQNVFPKYDIFIKEKKNVSATKKYGELNKLFKKIYKVNDVEKKKIINSKITNIYYSKEEIEKHIKEYL